MKTAASLALVLIAAAGPASAARWKPVSINAERAIFIDVDALARNGNVVQAWDWQKFNEPQVSASGQGSFVWVKSLTNYHCMRRTTDPVLKVYFGADGVELRRANLEGLQFPAAVEPDSLREKLLEMACNPPKPAVKPVAAEAKPAEKAPSPDAAAKADAPAKEASAAKDDATAKADAPAKADVGKEEKKADSKPAAKAEPEKAAAVQPAAASVRKPARIAPVVYHRTYTLPGHPLPKKKNAVASKVARATAKQDPACPPRAQSRDPSPLLTEANGDGLFN